MTNFTRGSFRWTIKLLEAKSKNRYYQIFPFFARFKLDKHIRLMQTHGVTVFRVVAGFRLSPEAVGGRIHPPADQPAVVSIKDYPHVL